MTQTPAESVSESVQTPSETVEPSYDPVETTIDSSETTAENAKTENQPETDGEETKNDWIQIFCRTHSMEPCNNIL